MLNVKLSNLQLNKLKSAIKNGTKVTSNPSLNTVGDSNDKNNFPHKLLLTNTQVSKLCKAFENNSSGNMQLSKTQLHKIVQSRGFLGRLLGPSLLKTELPLIINIFKSLAKSVLIPIRLMVAESATDTAINKEMFESGFTTLIISNEEMNDIMKIVKSIEESGLLLKGVYETVTKQNIKKDGFLECY